VRILAVNCGSSTLKFKLVEVAETTSTIAGALVERIGDENASLTFSAGDEIFDQRVTAPDHEAAILVVLDRLTSVGFATPEVFGHRVVHGGDHFAGPALIDSGVMYQIEDLGELAPLHNGPSLAAIRASLRVTNPPVPMVAVFDTAFHRTMPEPASLYPIPKELAEKHGIRRYGFHGTAHRCMVKRYSALTATPVEDTVLVTLQLGNGCSATAVAGGRSVDTSMGFTPLEGLMMGTRSGSVDPSLVGFLERREGVDASEVEEWLNKRSGLLGISGTSRDVRELLAAAERGDRRAALALEIFCDRLRKQVGAYLAVLGGADAVVFGGGIGENAPLLRERVLADMGWCGLVLDPERNASAVGVEARISAEGSKIHAYVVLVDEETRIAEDTADLLEASGGDGSKDGVMHNA
jgi:acetate kinase